MRTDQKSDSTIPDGMGLRGELSLRSLRMAAAQGYLHDRTNGHVPSIVFGRDEQGRHGNFTPEAYRQICATTAWAKRLEKVHTAHKRMRARSDWKWKELDCCSSSDALLMNIFCYPGVLSRREFRALLNTELEAEPEFGFRPRVPLRNGKGDTTEVDMRVGSLLVEAKLTETDFQWASPRLVNRYADLEMVFSVSELPQRNGRHSGYQLIRGTLAAYALGASFCLLCDARRPDLIDEWYKIQGAVRQADLRCRLKLLTWQELASALPRSLQEFLMVKYGIRAANG